MAGNTTTSSLTDSLNSIIASARIVREFEGVMPNLVDKKTLGVGIGLDWKEITLAALTAMAVTENVELHNPQEITDTIFQITPTVIGIHTILTDRVKARISPIVFGEIGRLGQNAIQRKKDEDGLVVLDGATTSLCGAGLCLASGYITAAQTRITSNVTEGTGSPIYCVLHGYQIKDLRDELTAGMLTAPVPEGLTARVFTENNVGRIGGVTVYEDGNITIDANADAKGGVFARDAIVLVQGRSPWSKEIRNEKLGGGATEYLLYDEYAWGERNAGTWLYELFSDATAPTS